LIVRSWFVMSVAFENGAHRLRGQQGQGQSCYIRPISNPQTAKLNQASGEPTSCGVCGFTQTRVIGMIGMF
jgi:hypothetical protein